MNSEKPVDFSNCQPRDWFAIGQLFNGPFTFENPNSGDTTAQNFGVSLSVQTLMAFDIGSQYMLLALPLPKLPGFVTADEIRGFLDAIFKKHGKPRVGILFADSVWQSSHELLLDDETRPRGEWLRDMEIEIPPMPESEKTIIRERLAGHNLRVVFGELNA